jgi:hypothetical protein
MAGAQRLVAQDYGDLVERVERLESAALRVVWASAGSYGDLMGAVSDLADELGIGSSPGDGEGTNKTA